MALSIGPARVSRVVEPDVELKNVVLLGFPPNSGLQFTYGNDPEIFSISTMKKVLEIQNSGTISRTIFFRTERYKIVFRKIPVYGTIVPKFSGKR